MFFPFFSRTFYNYAVWSTALGLRVAHNCQQSTRSRKPYIDSTTPFRQVVCDKFGGGAYAGSAPLESAPGNSNSECLWDAPPHRLAEGVLHLYQQYDCDCSLSKVTVGGSKQVIISTREERRCEKLCRWSFVAIVERRRHCFSPIEELSATECQTLASAAVTDTAESGRHVRCAMSNFLINPASSHF